MCSSIDIIDQKGTSMNSINNNYDQNSESSSSTLLFTNAWYGKSTKVWPPSSYIDPILLAIHAEPDFKAIFTTSVSRQYLQWNSPVGARDSATYAILCQMNVLAYKSSCLTMTLVFNKRNSSSSINSNKKAEIIIVDVPAKALKKYVPQSILNEATYMSHKAVSVDIVDDPVARYDSAFYYLRAYSMAQVVITSRLHAALPCLALGIPVVYVNDIAHLPGGGGKKGQERVKEHIKLTNVIDGNNYHDFNWSNVSFSLKSRHKFEKSRLKLLRMIVCRNDDIADSAVKFGIIPQNWIQQHSITKDPPCTSDSDPKTNSSNSNIIHLSFSLDVNFFQKSQGSVFATFLTTLAKHNKMNTFSVYVLVDGLRKSQQCIINILIRKYLNIKDVYIIQMQDTLDEYTKNYGITNKKIKHVSRITMARLYLVDLLPCVNKLIWLDLDVWVMSSLQELWEFDITASTSTDPTTITTSTNNRPPPSTSTSNNEKSNCAIMGRESVIKDFAKRFLMRDPAALTSLKISQSQVSNTGFNAGVLVLNLYKLRHQTWSLDRNMTFIEFRNILTKNGHNDQVIFNLWCNNNFIRLNPVWNVYLTKDDYMHKTNISTWKIFHWTGPNKDYATIMYKNISHKYSFLNQLFTIVKNVTFDDIL